MALDERPHPIGRQHGAERFRDLIDALDQPARSIEPDQLHRRLPCTLREHEPAGRGDREGSVDERPEAGAVADPVGYADGCTGRLEAGSVERLRVEAAVLLEEQTPGRVPPRANGRRRPCGSRGYPGCTGRRRHSRMRSGNACHPAETRDTAAADSRDRRWERRWRCRRPVGWCRPLLPRPAGKGSCPRGSTIRRADVWRPQAIVAHHRRARCASVCRLRRRRAPFRRVPRTPDTGLR